MSRTPKRSKGPGYDYWTRRASASKTCGASPGHETKKRASRVLRRRARQQGVES